MLLSACDRTEPGVFNPDFTSPLSLYTVPDLEDADAILMSIRSTAYDKQFDTDQPKRLGLASAVFYADPASKSLVDAGTVKVYGQQLTKGDNNFYTYSNPASQPMGIEFVELVTWSFTGGSDFTATAISSEQGWPMVGKLNAPNVISPDKSFSVASEYVANADEIVFRLTGTQKTIEVEKSGNNVAHTFSSDEIAELGSGVVMLQLEVTNIEVVEHEAKKLYLVNKEVQSDQLFIEE